MLLATLALVGCQSGGTNIPVSPNSDLGRQMLELDAKGRAVQNAPVFSKSLQDYEMAHGGNCTNMAFDRLQEPGERISPYTRFYAIEGVSPTCGRRLYHARITFRDSANTVVKRVEILFGPDEEANYREKAAEFIRYAQADDVQQMLAVTSSRSHATQSDSVRTVYAEQVVPQFQEVTVTWDAQGMPITDETKNVGLKFVGTVHGKKTYSFEVAVYKENGKLVVANIRKKP